jgi:CBS domain-containing protein
MFATTDTSTSTGTSMPASRSRRSQRANASSSKTGCRLEQLRARGDLRAKARHVLVARSHRRIGRRQHAVRLGGQPDQVHDVEVAYRSRLGLIGDLDLVATQAEDVPDAEKPAAEQIGLEREPVAVATTHVDDRLDSLGEGERRHCPGRHPGACAGVVSELHEVERARISRSLRRTSAVVGPRQRPEAYGQDRPVQDRLGDGPVTCLHCREHSSKMLTKFLRNDRLTLRASKAHFGIFSPRPEVTGAMSASDGYLIVEDLRAKAAQVRRADDRENGTASSLADGSRARGAPAPAASPANHELGEPGACFTYSPATPAVRHHMSSDLLSVEANLSIVEVAQRMVDRNVGAALVRDDDRLTGILTERDVLRAVARGLRKTGASPIT